MCVLVLSLLPEYARINYKHNCLNYSLLLPFSHRHCTTANLHGAQVDPWVMMEMCMCGYVKYKYDSDYRQYITVDHRSRLLVALRHISPVKQMTEHTLPSSGRHNGVFENTNHKRSVWVNHPLWMLMIRWEATEFISVTPQMYFWGSPVNLQTQEFWISIITPYKPPMKC